MRLLISCGEGKKQEGGRVCHTILLCRVHLDLAACELLLKDQPCRLLIVMDVSDRLGSAMYEF